MEQLRKMVQQSRTSLITHRAILERDIADLRSRLEASDPNLIKPLNIDLDTLTCEKRFPSMYEDKFSLEKYDSEREEYENMLRSIDKLRDELITQAKTELGIEPEGGAFQ